MLERSACAFCDVGCCLNRGGICIPSKWVSSFRLVELEFIEEATYSSRRVQSEGRNLKKKVTLFLCQKDSRFYLLGYNVLGYYNVKDKTLPEIHGER